MDADLAFRAVSRALVLPPGGPVLLGLAGVLLWARAPRLGRALVAFSLAILLVLSTPVVSDVLIQAVESYPAYDGANPVEADVIVVLGGGLRRNASAIGGAELTPASLERLSGAAGLARRTGLPLLLSGGAVEPGKAEADVMQQMLVRDFGLKARWVENVSRTTRENAGDTARLLATVGFHRILLVTSAVHMRRAMAEFAAVGFDVVPVAVGGTAGVGEGLTAWLPSTAALDRSYQALYELAGQRVAALTRAF